MHRDTLALSGDTLVLLGYTLALSGDTSALLGYTLALSGDTSALSGEALALHYRVLPNSLRINEILYLGNYVVQYRTHI